LVFDEAKQKNKINLSEDKKEMKALF